MCNEMTEMNKCLENVHLFENHCEDEQAIPGNDFETEHREHLQKYHRPMPPCHEREDRVFNGSIGQNRRAVCFDESVK